MLDSKIIDKFFQGKASKAEIERIAEYIYSDEADKELQTILADEFDRNNYHGLFDQKASKARILNKISQQNRVVAKEKHRMPVYLYKIVAALLFLIGFSFLLFMPDYKRNTTEMVSEDQRTLIKSTEKGQKLHIILPDSSKVVLNSLSSIEYPENFASNLRTIKLEGEAYFEVKNDTTKPFEVLFGTSMVKVLGTSFNISCRDLETTTVALTEGKVRINNTNGLDEVIYPGEMISLSNEEFAIESFDYKAMIGWKDGWLNFENDKFYQIKDKLELWYGVEFEIEGAPDAEYHYSGNYKNKSLQEVLDGISYVMKFDYQLNNDKVTIDF